ncbi:hypothetical protein NDU88_000425, partial [Pleurodeles waltl]
VLFGTLRTPTWRPREDVLCLSFSSVYGRSRRAHLPACTSPFLLFPSILDTGC